MDKRVLIPALAFLVFAFACGTSFAASGVVLENSGMGQQAGNVTDFGFSICNNGGQKVNQSVPVSVTVNGVTVLTKVNPPLNAVSCIYSYLAYSSFNLQSGKTYSVQVNIDPQRTIVQNTDTQATYSLTVPSGSVLGASITSAQLRTQMLAQLAALYNELEQLLAQAAKSGK